MDKGLRFCEAFCHVCLFPRLKDFIMNQDWNDPKSKLQQCCLTLRTMDGGEPDIPIYKVIESIGPTNTRIYTVAVYFREKRLACATGHSIQQAEMNAAKKALDTSQDLFLQLDHQKRVIARSMKRQHVNVNEGENKGGKGGGKRGEVEEKEEAWKAKMKRKREDCNLPKQYRVKVEGEGEDGDGESSDEDGDTTTTEETSSSGESSGEGSSSEEEEDVDDENNDLQGEKKKTNLSKRKVRDSSIDSRSSAIGNKLKAKKVESDSNDDSDDSDDDDSDDQGKGDDNKDQDKVKGNIVLPTPVVESDPESGEID